MLQELQRVVLLSGIPGDGLEPGDVGTIVHVYRDGLDGQTRAVATVEADQVRAVTERDMTHAREMQIA